MFQKKKHIHEQEDFIWQVGHEEVYQITRAQYITKLNKLNANDLV